MIGHLGNNFRAQKVDLHKFTMIPDAHIPRSTFRIQSQHKTTFEASFLTPVFVQEALPGDTWNLSMTAFIRMSTLIVPLMDNLDLESWFFFVPNRILWQHWVNFMGEQPATPNDSTSYTIPTVTPITANLFVGSIYDYMGVPITSYLTTVTINALPFRAVNLIWNQWFRDQNLQNAVGFGATGTVYDFGDGPDLPANYVLSQLVLNKRHDYFTSCLPWTQKNGPAGGTSVPYLVGQATVKTGATAIYSGAQTPVTWLTSTGGNPTAGDALSFNASFEIGTSATAAPVTGNPVYPSNMYADLTTVSNATINTLRLAFQTQKLLERDARGGTRYTEIIRSHFGVTSPDARLQRPEYLGGGKQAVNIVPIPQTSATGLTGGTTPSGNLSAIGTVTANKHGFRQSFTEHGYIIGLVGVRRDQAYQQGLNRLFTRSTRYDFYWPSFCSIGEQAIRNDEIYVQGTAADSQTFGFNERYAEYRFMPSRTSGSFRSTVTGPLDYWHCATKYAAIPLLNSTFIEDDTGGVLARNLALGVAAAEYQFQADFFFDAKVARPMPMYGVPGLIDHF